MSMIPPVFSIVTPSFNQGEFIRRTIDSVMGQRGVFTVDYEIRDNNSTDATPDILREFNGRAKIVCEADKGQADAINRSWRSSSGDWLAWLNADDMYEPGALATVAAAIEARPDARWIVGRFRIVDRNDRPIGKLHSCYKNFLLGHYSYSLLLSENIIPQMSVFIRRDLWQEVGDLITDDHLAFDYEYWLRLGRTCDPVVLPDCLSVYRYYPNTKTASGLKTQFARGLRYAEVYSQHSRWPYRFHVLNYWKTVLLYDLVKRF
jgi:glycosyltransferase involved in cell wall biosynthesis